MSALMRPAIYGAYHHITVIGKHPKQHFEKVDVVGSLYFHLESDENK